MKKKTTYLVGDFTGATAQVRKMLGSEQIDFNEEGTQQPIRVSSTKNQDFVFADSRQYGDDVLNALKNKEDYFVFDGCLDGMEIQVDESSISIKRQKEETALEIHI